jgi:hypothetical protein
MALNIVGDLLNDQAGASIGFGLGLIAIVGGSWAVAKRKWKAALISILIIVPLAYAVALTTLYLVSPHSAEVWVSPSSELVQAWLPNASLIIRGHAAAGNPAFGLINAHLLAVAMLSAALLVLVGITIALRSSGWLMQVPLFTANDRKQSPEPLWLQLILFFVLSFIGFFIIWILAAGTIQVGFEGEFLPGSGGRGGNLGRATGLWLVFSAQLASLALLRASLYLIAWLKPLASAERQGLDHASKP